MIHRGRVSMQRRGGSSKSEREAVVLETDAGALVLRIEGGNAFSDPRLDALVGKTIEAEGVVHGGVLIMTQWTETPV